ncbi:MAG: O-acetylhomoserine (thiol)-lyase [Parcubacteria group bacterium Gr01-1014_29]|nr:MAG: O-acetylhomoserine (thiol)-lyase [Parcubacteria group bacterium Gr01-1014_29]
MISKITMRSHSIFGNCFLERVTGSLCSFLARDCLMCYVTGKFERREYVMNPKITLGPEQSIIRNRQDLKTVCIRGGYDPFDDPHGAILPPLYRGVTYVMPDTETAERMVRGDEYGYVYGRFGNPTVAILERCVAELEGSNAEDFLLKGVDALACASGNAAHRLLITHFCSSGDNIVLSPYLYGGTRHLVEHRVSFANIEARFVEDPTDIESWRRLIDDRTQYLFVEVPTNPHGYMYDIQSLADLAHSFGKPLVVDSTIATPILLRPLEFGADFVTHSLTKCAAGYSQGMGGIIVGSREAIHHCRMSEARDEGSVLAPDVAWLIRLGIMTLYERVMAHARNTYSLVSALQQHPRIRKVWHPLSSDHPTYDVAARLLEGYPSLVYVEVDGGEQETRRFMDALRFCRNCVHLGDSNTFATHCWSTTHGVLQPKEKESSGIVSNGVRFSVGIEDIMTIIPDIMQALEKI